MMKTCAFCVLYAWISLQFIDTGSRSMAPRITEPLKNMNIQVKAGSKIDLHCSASIESNSSIEVTVIYWLINGSFIQNDSSVQEGYQRVF
ncbi:uncharacterized protein ACNLHF_008509 isoform 2-T2 [Anomaloglossus baeobatrachus]